MTAVSSIRLTYSGLIGFSIRISSVVTGIIFTLFVTRNLEPEDFGIWRIIGSFIAYVLIIDPITSYWLQRQIARNEPVGKSGLALNSSLSIIATLAYVILVFFFTDNVSYDVGILLFGAIIIPLNFLSNTFDSVNYGFKPQATSYSFLGFELAKIPVGFVLIVMLDQGIYGAIIATAAAFGVRCIITGYNAREKIKDKIQKSYIFSWIRLSWLTLYGNVSALIFTLDVLVFTLIVGSLEALATVAAAQVISGTIAYTNSISQSLTPKLIAEKNEEHVFKILKTVSMFVIPITAAAIIFAKPGLYMLNPIYAEGVMIVIYWSIWGIIYVYTEISFRVLQGYESVDADTNSSVKDYLKSKLFVIPSVYNIHYIIYIGGLAITLFIFLDSETPLKLAEYWAILSLFLQIPFLIWGWKKVSEIIPLKIPYPNIIKYVGITIASSMVVLFSQDYILVYEKELFVFAPKLIALALIGGIAYFGLLIIVDKDFKKMMRSIITELRSR